MQRRSEAGHLTYILKSHLDWELFDCKEKKNYSNKLKKGVQLTLRGMEIVDGRVHQWPQILTSPLFPCPLPGDLLLPMKSQQASCIRSFGLGSSHAFPLPRGQHGWAAH